MAAIEPQKQRVYVFVDFWNFQLELNRIDGPRFDADFKSLGKVLADAAIEIVDKDLRADFAGLNLYISSDMASQAEAGMRSGLAMLTHLLASMCAWFRAKKKKKVQNAPIKDVGNSLQSARTAMGICAAQKKRVSM